MFSDVSFEINISIVVTELLPFTLTRKCITFYWKIKYRITPAKTIDSLILLSAYRKPLYTYRDIRYVPRK